MSTSSLRITKLSKVDNFVTWKTAIEALLTKSNEWTIINAPQDVPEADRPDKNAQALATLRLNVADELLYLLADDFPSAHAAWHKLLGIYGSQLKARIVELNQHLAQICQKENERATDFIARMENLKAKFALAGEPLTNDNYLTYVVSKIHPSYNVQRSILTSRLSQGDLTISEVQTTLIIAESQAALDAKVPKTRSSGNTPAYQAYPMHSSGKGGVRCHYCKRTGHMKRACPKFKADREGKHCSYCNKKGHTVDECYKKKHADASPPAISGALAYIAAPAPLPKPKPKWVNVFNLEDWRLNHDKFAELDQEYGPFDRDGAADAAGANALCDDYCYKDGRSFLELSSSGLNTWVNPPWRRAGAWLSKGWRNWEDDPLNTSMMFVLPYRPEADWWHLTGRMKLVRFYAAGTSDLFTMPSKDAGGLRHSMRKCPYDVAIFWLAPADPNSETGRRAATGQLPKHTTPYGGSPLGNLSTAPGRDIVSLSEEDILLDTGAGRHMTSNPSLLINPRELSPEDQGAVRGIGGHMICPTHKGDICMSVGKQRQPIMFKGVLFVPGLGTTLISLGSMAAQGAVVQLRGDSLDVYESAGSKQPHMQGERVANVYRLINWRNEPELCSQRQPVPPKPAASNRQRQPVPAMPAASNSQPQLELWHNRLGHLSYRSIAKLTTMAQGINGAASDYMAKAAAGDVCAPCQEGSQVRDSRPLSERPKSLVRLERLHTDLCGPFEEESDMGNRYYLLVIDEATRFSELIPIKHKSDAADKLLQVMAAWERSTSKQVRCVRSDRGGEFFSTALLDELKRRGIKHEPTAGYSPESNGLAERTNRTIMDKVRSMMAWAGAPKSLWAECAVYANLLRNVSPASGLDKTPYELFNGRRPDLSRLRTFGCTVYVYVPKELRKKLDPRAVPAILLAVHPDAKTAKVMLLDGQRKDVRDYVCDESKPGWEQLVAEYPASPRVEAPVDEHLDRFNSDNEEERRATSPEENEPTSGDPGSADDTGVTTGDGSSTPRRYPTRERREPERFTPAKAAVTTTKIIEPKTVSEARATPQWDEWWAAMQLEINALQESGTWQLVKTPLGIKPLPCKWVFKVKYNPDGSVERFKARLVAGGHRQQDGIDYGEVFAPVTKFATLRALLAKAAHDNLELGYLDISNAFLHGELKHPVYMRQPEGFESGDPSVSCQLHKTLYGLKQAPKEWYNVLRDGLTSSGFVACDSDLALWKTASTPVVYLVHYVDDFAIGSKDEAALKGAKAKILTKFKGRDLADATDYLNIKMSRDREARTITISQPNHATAILERFSMHDAKPRAVPMAKGADYSLAGDNDELLSDRTRYQECVGALLYLAGVSRPDLSLAVSILTRAMANPSVRHWELLKGVMRYLAGTTKLGIKYGGSGKGGLLGYTDSDFASCKNTRRSRGGFMFSLFGGAVAWQSKLQQVVSTSTAEAEYIAAAAAAREAVWLQRITSFLDIQRDGPLLINSDNQATIHMVANSSDSARTKHIDVCYHYVRQQAARGNLRLGYVSTNDNVADIFTKPLEQSKFEHFRSGLGMA